MPTKKESIINEINGAGKQTQPQTPQQPKQTNIPLHHANLALQSISARQAESDATNDAKVYAVAYSQAYTIEVLRLKGEFLQSFHQQSNHSQSIAREALTQDSNESFFSQSQELEAMIEQLNSYQPPSLPAPTYNLLPPSLG